MIIDIQKVIRETLREGETFESVNTQLINLAKYHMIRHWKGAGGLRERLNQRDDMLYTEFRELFNSRKLDASMYQRFSKIVYDHKVGYLGEMSVHSALKHDWRDVFKYNAINVKYNLQDGEVHEGDISLTFDVKSHHKDLCGLSIAADRVRCDLYIACHWIEARMHILGYATKADVLSAHENQYKKLCIAPSALRPFSDFLQRFH